MKKEESYIRNRCGSRTPFRVPEGYFEQFTPRLMNRLPQQEAKPAPASTPRIGLHRRHWLYAAATVCGIALLTGGAYRMIQRSNIGSIPAVTANVWTGDLTTGSDDDEFNEVLDYALVDNQEIAMYLIDND